LASAGLHQFKYVFYGAGHNWTQPRLKMCLYCKGELKPSVSSCITVENIQQKPDEGKINVHSQYNIYLMAVDYKLILIITMIINTAFYWLYILLL